MAKKNLNIIKITTFTEIHAEIPRNEDYSHQVIRLSNLPLKYGNSKIRISRTPSSKEDYIDVSLDELKRMGRLIDEFLIAYEREIE